MAVVRRGVRFWRWTSCLVIVLVLGATVFAQDEPTVYETDLAAFFAEVDNTYPFFDLKGIRGDWETKKTDLSERVKTCRSDTGFLELVTEAIGCLRDAHMGFRKTRVDRPPWPKEYYPGIGFMPAADGRVVVMSAASQYADTLKTGTIIAEINGQNAREYLEQRAKEAWDKGFTPSPQRARLFAYRIPLKGDQGDKHTLTFLSEGQELGMLVTCDVEARGWPHTYNLPSGLKRAGRSFYHTRLDSGVGYIYLRRIDQSTEPGMTQALEAVPNAKGWIIDLRGNGGGGYGAGFIEQMKAMPRPVAVLIDAGCVSAGETVARDLARYAEARLFGSRTAGSSSSKRAWPFPSGIATLTLSTRSRWRNDGEPIEFNGIEPDVALEPDPDEVARGQNTAILRAEEYLLEQQ